MTLIYRGSILIHCQACQMLQAGSLPCSLPSGCSAYTPSSACLLCHFAYAVDPICELGSTCVQQEIGGRGGAHQRNSVNHQNLSARLAKPEAKYRAAEKMRVWIVPYSSSSVHCTTRSTSSPGRHHCSQAGILWTAMHAQLAEMATAHTDRVTAQPPGGTQLLAPSSAWRYVLPMHLPVRLAQKPLWLCVPHRQHAGGGPARKESTGLGTPARG